METGYPEASVTLIALNDGTTSLYFSSGGGLIGGGEHESVGRTARRMVRSAVEHLRALSPTSEFPLPAPGETRFYVLTTHGVVGASAPEASLGENHHGLSPLFYAGQDVITALRKIEEQRRR